MKLLLLFVLLLDLANSFAQSESQVDQSFDMMKQKWSKDDVYSQDFYRKHQQPDPLNPIYIREEPIIQGNFGFSRNEYVAMSLAAGMAVVAFASEREMLEFVQSHNGKVYDDLKEVGAFAGSRGMAMGLAGGYILGVVTGNDKLSKTCLIAVEAGVFNWFINDSLKQVFRRALPSETSDPFMMTEEEKASDMGMPSGHTTTAFAIATIFADQYGKESKIIPVIAYGIASLTAWSRVYSNSHWASDVFIGAIVGHVTAKMLEGTLEHNDTGKYQYVVVPYYRRNEKNGAGGGIIVQITGKDSKEFCKEGDWECFGRTINKKR